MEWVADIAAAEVADVAAAAALVVVAVVAESATSRQPRQNENGRSINRPSVCLVHDLVATTRSDVSDNCSGANRAQRFRTS